MRTTPWLLPTNGKITLSYIIKNYYILEQMIQDQVIKDVFHKLLSAGFRFNAPEFHFARGHQFLRPIVARGGKLRRDLSIDFEDLSGKELSKELSTDLISSYGLIRTVSIQSPLDEDSKCLLGHQVASDVGTKLRNEYNNLAESAVLASQEFTSTALNGLYLILHRITAKISGFDYEKHCWFILFSGNYGYFLLTPEMISSALDHFRDNPLPDISPIEQFIYLITNPLPFELTVSNEAVRQSRAWLPGTFEESKYKIAASRLWKSIARLQDYQDFIVMPVAEHRDYHLILGLKATFQNPVKNVILDHKEALVRQFEKGLEQYSDYVHLVGSARADEGQPLIDQVSDELSQESDNHADTILLFLGRSQPKDKPPQVFISYDRHDERWLSKLKIALSPLVQRRCIKLWDDTDILPGRERQSMILKEIKRSHLVIILVTQNYLASQSINEFELPAILERQREGYLEVLWIPVSAALIDGTSIEGLQAGFDSITRPLDSLSESEQYMALVKIARAVTDRTSRLL